jgi:hypothetical protein
MNTLLNIVKAQIHGGGKFEMQSEPTATSSPLRSRVTHYHGTLAALPLIILFSEMFKFSPKNIQRTKSCEGNNWIFRYTLFVEMKISK